MRDGVYAVWPRFGQKIGGKHCIHGYKFRALFQIFNGAGVYISGYDEPCTDSGHIGPEIL